MAHLEQLKATGLVKVYKNGELVRDINNLVVTAGKNYIAAKMADTNGSTPTMSYMAIGTGTASPSASDTALASQASQGIVSLSASVTGNAVTYTATFPAGAGTGTITEAGIFDASSSGNMLCRTVFPAVTKQSADSISITWVVTVS